MIPYGLDPRGLPAARSPATRDARAAAPTVLFVGRLVAYKGVDVLLRAMAGVPASLVVVGDGPLRGRWKRWRARAGRRRLASGSWATSATPSGSSGIGARDLLALPSVSRQEAFGMVQVEAMLCRPSGHQHRAADRRALGQPRRRVRPGGAARDVDALRAALVRLCGDAALRASLGAQGPRARAGASSPPAACARRIDELCRAVGPAAGRRAAAGSSSRAVVAQARAGRGAGRGRPGRLGAALGAHRAVHQARGRRPGVLRPGTLRLEWPAVPRPQVPVDDSRCRGGDGRDSGHRARSRA